MDSSIQSRNVLLVAPPEKISLKALQYRYPTRTPLTLECELKQIEAAVKTGRPRLKLEPLRDDTLSVVGYGPSLQETWKEVTHPCITTSGAHDFLIGKGFIPDWHAQCDGRDHQIEFLSKPNINVTYLMATIVHPAIWERLRGFQVLLWHNCNGPHVVEWIGRNDPNTIMVAGGSNIGLTAIHLGGILGFRKFKIFGLDCNWRGNARHAGKHPFPQQDRITRVAGGREWQTSPQMSNAVDEFLVLARNKNLEFDVYGTSLLTAALEDGH